MMHHRPIASLLAGCATVVISTPASAAERELVYALPAADLSVSLREVARRSGRSIVAPSGLVAGVRAPAVSGSFSAEGAVRALLTGTQLSVRHVGGALVVGPAQDASFRPAAEQASEATGDPDIVVTGTRIRGAAPVGSPVTSVTRSDIERGGYATTQQILQDLPQNFGGGPGEATSGISVRANASANSSFGSSINLRGLGTSSTLVLLDGSRPPLGGFSGAFADLSLIPATAIERIEILPDGASALYGSDAVAGVVNIIPRKRFTGLEATLRAGTADGDFGEVQFGTIAGTKWGSGNAVIAYEYYRRDALAAADRPYATNDLRPFGGPDYRQAFATPGTIFAGGQPFAIPPGQDGRNLQPSDLIPGSVNLGDSWAGTDVLPRQERHALFVHIRQEVGPVTLFADVLGAHRRFSLRPRPISLAPRTVGPTNPFYIDPLGTGQPVQVFYDFRADLGPEVQSGRVKAAAGTAGMEATLGRWSVEAHGSFGLQDETSKLHNVVNSARLALALADTNPATAYNLFGSGGSTNPATIESIRGYSDSFFRYSTAGAAARADGPLFDLPGGAIRVAIGGEYREESFRGRAVGYRSGLVPNELELDFPEPRKISAAYAELLIPLFGEANARPGLERLAVSLAGRVEHYSDFGTTANPKAGLSWSPAKGVTARGSYGTSFRAPAFSDLQQGPETRLYFVYPLPDPNAPGGSTVALILRGNDPAIGPERARTWTAGVDLEPAFLPGFRLSTTWFDISYRDRISDPSSELFNIFANPDIYGALIDRSPSAADVAAYYANPAFLDLFGLPPSAVAAIVDARNQNLAVVAEEGLDLEATYARPMMGGRMEVGASGTWLSDLRQAITAEAPSASIVGTVGNPTRLRLRGHALWSNDRFGMFAAVNHVSGYENKAIPVPEHVSSWTTFDLQLSANLAGRSGGPGLRLALNVSNLFDTDPPYVNGFNGLNAIGYDPDNASAVGRFISVQATVKW
ncbi:MAG: TonB-dependent receptor [Alphaproteobacteria bacterium]|nr:MAG: TonB-dependent receptor [Alphaproteobacteria bacterium]